MEEKEQLPKKAEESIEELIDGLAEPETLPATTAKELAQTAANFLRLMDGVTTAEEYWRKLYAACLSSGVAFDVDDSKARLIAKRREIQKQAVEIKDLARAVLKAEEAASEEKRKATDAAAKDKALTNDAQRKARVNELLELSESFRQLLIEKEQTEKRLDELVELNRLDEFILKLDLIDYEAEKLGRRDYQRGYDRKIMLPSL